MYYHSVNYPWAGIIAAIFLVIEVAFATEITVLVGSDGTVSFSPSSVTTVSPGDTVGFIFKSGSHSIVQSSFENPCSPLANGATSGLHVATPSTIDTVLWSVEVPDSTTAMWFFCSQTVPVNHCKSGMVFAINPTAGQSFDTFQAIAEGKLTSNSGPGTQTQTTTQTTTQTQTQTSLGVQSTSDTVVTTDLLVETITPLEVISQNNVQSSISPSSIVTLQNNSTSTFISSVLSGSSGMGLNGTITQTVSQPDASVTSVITSPSPKSGFSQGGVAGIVIGGVVALGLVLVIVLRYHRENTSSQHWFSKHETSLQSPLTPFTDMESHNSSSVKLIEKFLQYPFAAEQGSSSRHYVVSPPPQYSR